MALGSVSAIAAPAPMRGIGYMVGGGALLTLNDVVMKWTSADYPIGEILFLRGIFVFIPIAALAWYGGGWKALRVNNPGGQLVRGGLVVCSTFLFVTALSLMPIADLFAISFAGPLFLTALAPWLLAEKVGWRRWSAVLCGFIGVLVIIRPGGDMLGWVALLPLAASLLGALRDIVTRRISTTEPSTAVLAVSTAMVVLASALTLPFAWRTPSPADVAMLAVAGVLLGSAHYLLIEAFRLAEAALVAPFKYATMIWAVILGYLVWGDLPDRWVFAGSALVVASGLYILHRERRDITTRSVTPAT